MFIVHKFGVLKFTVSKKGTSSFSFLSWKTPDKICSARFTVFFISEVRSRGFLWLIQCFWPMLCTVPEHLLYLTHVMWMVVHGYGESDQSVGMNTDWTKAFVHVLANWFRSPFTKSKSMTDNLLVYTCITLFEKSSPAQLLESGSYLFIAHSDCTNI